MSSRNVSCETLGLIQNELKTVSIRRYNIITDELSSPNCAQFVSNFCSNVTKLNISPFIPVSPTTNDASTADSLSVRCPLYFHYQQALDPLLISSLEPLWNRIFAGCSTEDGKALSRHDRQLASNNSYTLIYGEIAFDSYCRVLWDDLCGLIDYHDTDGSIRGGVYYDLGSGTGRALFASVMVHSFHKVVGIEILASLHKAAEERNILYNDMITEGLVANQPIELVLGSFFDYDWSDGDLIFANSTCFSEEMFQQIAFQCSKLRDGAIIITFSEELEAPYLTLLSSKEYNMSWGNATVFIHKKVPVRSIDEDD